MAQGLCIDCQRPVLAPFKKCAGHLLHTRRVVRELKGHEPIRPENAGGKHILSDRRLIALALVEGHDPSWLHRSKT